MLLFVVLTTLTINAQDIYVGGSVGLWHNNDADATSFAITPEVGYNLNNKWALGATLAYAHTDLNSTTVNIFGLAPYARYSYYENKIVRLFIDGGFGFSTAKEKHHDAVNGFEIGLKPGIAISLNRSFSVIAKCGFLGYRDDYMVGDNGYGFGLTSEDLSFGFLYKF